MVRRMRVSHFLIPAIPPISSITRIVRNLFSRKTVERITSLSRHTIEVSQLIFLKRRNNHFSSVNLSILVNFSFFSLEFHLERENELTINGRCQILLFFWRRWWLISASHRDFHWRKDASLFHFPWKINSIEWSQWVSTGNDTKTQFDLLVDLWSSSRHSIIRLVHWEFCRTLSSFVSTVVLCRWLTWTIQKKNFSLKQEQKETSFDGCQSNRCDRESWQCRTDSFYSMERKILSWNCCSEASRPVVREKEKIVCRRKRIGKREWGEDDHRIDDVNETSRDESSSTDRTKKNRLRQRKFVWKQIDKLKTKKSMLNSSKFIDIDVLLSLKLFVK